MSQDKPLQIVFQVQLSRIMSKLAGNKTHAAGPKKPSLGQQEHGE
jgi:hypothetical protein